MVKAIASFIAVAAALPISAPVATRVAGRPKPRTLLVFEAATAVIEPYPIAWLIDFILHLDKHLVELLRDFGPWIYLILFLIIFSAAYVLLSENQADSFSETLGRTDALYFTVTVFATVGFVVVRPPRRRGGQREQDHRHERQHEPRGHPPARLLELARRVRDGSARPVQRPRRRADQEGRQARAGERRQGERH